MRPIRLLVAADQQVYLSLRQACQVEVDLELLGQTQLGAQAVELARITHADVMILDLDLPNMDPFPTIRRVVAQNPDTQIIVLSAHQRPDDLFEAIKAGACGYLPKNIDQEKLLQAIRAAHRGQAQFDTLAAAWVLNEYRRLSQDPNDAK